MLSLMADWSRWQKEIQKPRDKYRQWISGPRGHPDKEERRPLS